MAFCSTIAALEALKTKLEALQWTPPVEGGVAAAAFERVEIFDISELETALTELRVFKGRVCFIILDTETFTTEGGPTKLIVRQTRQVAILIADRDYGARQRALVGSAASPGVLGLKDLVLNGEADAPQKSILGSLVDGVACVPTNGTVMELRGEQRDDLAGRVVCEQDVELRGGYREVRLNQVCM